MRELRLIIWLALPRCDRLRVVTTYGDLLLVARLHVDLQRVISAACPA
jgi:hypothetical protein